MNSLELTAIWPETINKVEKGERILGGTTGNANMATKQLGDRTEYLKINLDPIAASEVLSSRHSTLQEAIDHAHLLGVPVRLTSDVSLSESTDFKGVTIKNDGHTIDIGSFSISNVVDVDFHQKGETIKQNAGLSAVTVPSSSAMKFICDKTEDSFTVISTGGIKGLVTKFIKGNISDPVLPQSSEAKNFEFWRPTLVSQLHYGAVLKQTIAKEILTGTGQITSLDVLNSVFRGSDNNIVNNKMLSVKRLDAGSSGLAGVEYNIDAAFNSSTNLLFYGTPASTGTAKIYVDDVLVKEVNLQSTELALRIIELEVASGKRKVRVENSKSGTYVYVAGINFSQMKPSIQMTHDVDFCFYYANKPDYIDNYGSADYAVLSATNKLWCGSYHGGETARYPAELYVDNNLIDFSKNIYIGKKISLLQQTTLNWSSGESMDVNTLSFVTDSGIYMRGTCENVNLNCGSAFFGMTPASTNFTSSMGTKFIDQALIDQTYQFVGGLDVVQINRENGLMVRTCTSKMPFYKNNYSGSTVSAKAVYNKFYPHFIRGGSQQMPSSFPWSFSREFF